MTSETSTPYSPPPWSYVVRVPIGGVNIRFRLLCHVSIRYRNFYFNHFRPKINKKFRFLRNSISTMTAEHWCGFKCWGSHYVDVAISMDPHRRSAVPKFTFFFVQRNIMFVRWKSHPLRYANFLQAPKLNFKIEIDVRKKKEKVGPQNISADPISGPHRHSADPIIWVCPDV